MEIKFQICLIPINLLGVMHVLTWIKNAKCAIVKMGYECATFLTAEELATVVPFVGTRAYPRPSVDREKLILEML